MTGKRHFRSIISFFSFFVFFTLVTIGGANARVVASDSTIIDRLNKRLGVSIPAEFSAKLLDFVLNDTIMHTRSATAYTENFIINEMKKDRGISKQNQLLFIRSTIYAGISQRTLYDRLDDENENRSDEYEKALKQINSSYEEYKKGFKTYMEKGIAEARQQSAEARQQSAEARQQSAEARQQSAEARQQSAEALNSSLKNLARFYNRYKKDPSTIKDEEIKQRKEKGRQVVQGCKELGIDYKSKLSPEMLKFYEVE